MLNNLRLCRPRTHFEKEFDFNKIQLTGNDQNYTLHVYFRNLC